MKTVGKIIGTVALLAVGYGAGNFMKGRAIEAKPYQITEEKGTYYFVDKGNDLKVKAEKISPMYNTVMSLTEILEEVSTSKQSLKDLLK